MSNKHRLDHKIVPQYQKHTGVQIITKEATKNSGALH